MRTGLSDLGGTGDRTRAVASVRLHPALVNDVEVVRFSAVDLMMVSVLLRLRPSGLLAEFPRLAAYVACGEARPAYGRAFAAPREVNGAGPRTSGSSR